MSDPWSIHVGDDALKPRAGTLGALPAHGDDHLIGRGRIDDDLLTHRYVTEDTVLGLAFLASVARWANVDAPIAHGLLAIVGGVLGHDLRQGPRTLEALGLAGLTHGELQQVLGTKAQG